MFVVKVDGVPTGVHNTYDAAAGAAEAFRSRGQTITITKFRDEEFASILRQLDDQEKCDAARSARYRRLWAATSGSPE
jgi:hypothetical protein